jgi:hypothetical protein
MIILPVRQETASFPSHSFVRVQMHSMTVKPKSRTEATWKQHIPQVLPIVIHTFITPL